MQLTELLEIGEKNKTVNSLGKIGKKCRAHYIFRIIIDSKEKSSLGDHALDSSYDSNALPGTEGQQANSSVINFVLFADSDSSIEGIKPDNSLMSKVQADKRLIIIEFAYTKGFSPQAE